jgi:hypothetical protein
MNLRLKVIVLDGLDDLQAPRGLGDADELTCCTGTTTSRYAYKGEITSSLYCRLCAGSTLWSVKVAG